jgi:hypothetical protein
MDITAGALLPNGERPHWSSQSHTLIHGPATKDVDGRDPGPARVGQAGRTASGGSMESTRTAGSSPSRVSARALPQLSRRTGFWAIAFSFLAVAAFSTAPSSLYGLYEQQEHLSSLTITIVYAVYALGIVVSLLLAGYVSDWYGRRAVLWPPWPSPLPRPSSS